MKIFAAEVTKLTAAFHSISVEVMCIMHAGVWLDHSAIALPCRLCNVFAAQCYASAAYAIMWCMSVCVFLTFVHSVKTNFFEITVG